MTERDEERMLEDELAEELDYEEREEAEEEEEPITCPFCLEEVKEGATRCPHCAGAFDKPASAE